MNYTAICNYFVSESEELLAQWDGTISLQSVPGRLDWKRLLKPIPCGECWIEKGFECDGASSGIFRFLIPKWRHPIASFRHDKRCAMIRKLQEQGMDKKKTRELRLISDQLFKIDLSIGQKKGVRCFIETHAGYIGVRIGAHLGIGSKR